MILDAMRHLFADPAALASQIPRFTEAEVEPTARGWLVGGEHLLHRDQDLTIMLIDTLPGVVQPPHEHNVDVFIGVFEGCEGQRFWKRTDDGIVSTPGQSLKAGDILSLGVQAVHAISAPATNTLVPYTSTTLHVQSFIPSHFSSIGIQATAMTNFVEQAAEPHSLLAQFGRFGP